MQFLMALKNQNVICKVFNSKLCMMLSNTALKQEESKNGLQTFLFLFLLFLTLRRDISSFTQYFAACFDIFSKLYKFVLVQSLYNSSSNADHVIATIFVSIQIYIWNIFYLWILLFTAYQNYAAVVSKHWQVSTNEVEDLDGTCAQRGY